VVEGLKDWLPARKAQRVMAPVCELINILNNYLPPEVETILSQDLVAVRGDFLGGNIVRKMMYEQVRVAVEKYKIEWVACQTTAQASRCASFAVSFICLSYIFLFSARLQSALRDSIRQNA
jgi:hypothetical protein